MSGVGGAQRAEMPAAGARSKSGGLLQRYEWLRGYLLMSPTMLLMLAMLIVPIIALVLISFWTQDLYSIDTTFTLDNYWQPDRARRSGRPIGGAFPFPWPIPSMPSCWSSRSSCP